MDRTTLYQDIAKRTQGDIYIGVVGPVRTGKSTFIKRFAELLMLPHIDNEYEKARVIDELPQSGAGRTVMTTQPRFVPNEAVSIQLDDHVTCSVRLVDCVGFLVPDAVGATEGGENRMVSTPWFDHDIPFTEAAEIGTRKLQSGSLSQQTVRLRTFLVKAICRRKNKRFVLYRRQENRM